VRRGLTQALVLGVLLGGCADDLSRANEVDKPRVLGALLRLEGEPEATTPRPGETVEVEWLLVQPDGSPVNASWAFATCQSAPTGLGINFCAGDPFAIDAAVDPTTEAPATSVEIPTSFLAEEALMIGVFCIDGSVNLDATTEIDVSSLDTLCSEGATPIPVSLPFEVRQDERPRNQSPSFESATIDGVEWTAESAESCEGLPSFPVDGDEITIELRAELGSNEAYTVLAGDPPEPTERVEELQTSLFATAGTIAQTFVFIEDATVPEEIDWTPPAADDEDVTVPPEGLVVRFYFVMRDLRGGVDVMTRAACVTP